MTELEVTSQDGTGAGLLRFLDWGIRTGELPEGSAKALRTAVKNVLSIDGDPAAVDVRNMDVEGYLQRFWNRTRDDFSDGTKTVYQQRFRQAHRMYLARLDGDKEWRAAGPAFRSRQSRKGDGLGNGGRSSRGHDAGSAARSSPSPGAGEEQGDVNFTPLPPGLIEFPFPLRPGLLVRLQLPEDLTKAEAERIARYVEALSQDERPAIAARPHEPERDQQDSSPSMT